MTDAEQIAALQARVLELEAEYARLRAALAEALDPTIEPDEEVWDVEFDALGRIGR